MKYRIIHEVNGLGKEHWEVQFYEEHWYGRRWEHAKRYVCDGQFQVKARYATLKEANDAVNARVIHRTIQEEGVINDYLNEV
jgi:hypothetical protein